MKILCGNAGMVTPVPCCVLLLVEFTAILDKYTVFFLRQG
jgi:hypothetical protein